MALRARRDSARAKSRTMATARTIRLVLQLRSNAVDFMASIRSRTLGPFTPVDPLREV